MPNYTQKYISVFNSLDTEVLLDTGSNNSVYNSLSTGSEIINSESSPENIIILTKDKELLKYLRQNGLLAANSLVSRVYSIISRALVNELNLPIDGNLEDNLGGELEYNIKLRNKIQENEIILGLQQELEQFLKEEALVKFNDIDARNNLIAKLDQLLCSCISENKKVKDKDFDYVHDALVNALVFTRNFKFPKEDPSKLHPSYSEDDQYGFLKNIKLPDDKTYCVKLNNSQLVNLYNSKKLLWHVNQFHNKNENLENLESLISRLNATERNSFLDSIANYISDNKLRSFFLGTGIIATFLYIPMYLSFYPFLSNILLFGISISTTQLVTGISLGLLPAVINLLMGLIDVSVTAIVSLLEAGFGYIWNLDFLNSEEHFEDVKKQDLEYDKKINKLSYHVGRNDKYQNIYEGKLLNLPGINSIVVGLENFARRYSNWSMSQSHINPISWSLFALAKIANTHMNLWMDNFFAFADNLEAETQQDFHKNKEKSESGKNSFEETHLALKRNVNNTYTCFKKINNKLDFYKTINIGSLDSKLRKLIIEKPEEIKDKIFKSNNHVEERKVFDIKNYIYNTEYPEILFVPEDIIGSIEDDIPYIYEYVIYEYFVECISNGLSLISEAIKLLTITAPITLISFAVNEIAMQLFVVTPLLCLLNVCTFILEYFEDNTIKNYLYDFECGINTFVGSVRTFFRRNISHFNSYLYNSEIESFIFKDNIIVDGGSASVTGICIKEILFKEEKNIQSEIILKLDRAIETFNEVTKNMNYFHNQLIDNQELKIDLKVVEYLKHAKELINEFNNSCRDLYSKKINNELIKELDYKKIELKSLLEEVFMLADYLDFVYSNKDKPLEHIITSKPRFSDHSAFEFLSYLTKVLCNQHVISNMLNGSISTTISPKIHKFEDFVSQDESKGINEIIKAIQDIKFEELNGKKTLKFQEKLIEIRDSENCSSEVKGIIDNIYALFYCLEQNRYGKSGMENLNFLFNFTNREGRDGSLISDDSIVIASSSMHYTPSDENVSMVQKIFGSFRLK